MLCAFFVFYREVTAGTRLAGCFLFCPGSWRIVANTALQLPSGPPCSPNPPLTSPCQPMLCHRALLRAGGWLKESVSWSRGHFQSLPAFLSFSLLFIVTSPFPDPKRSSQLSPLLPAKWLILGTNRRPYPRSPQAIVRLDSCHDSVRCSLSNNITATSTIILSQLSKPNHIKTINGLSSTDFQASIDLCQ